MFQNYTFSLRIKKKAKIVLTPISFPFGEMKTGSMY